MNAEMKKNTRLRKEFNKKLDKDERYFPPRFRSMVREYTIKQVGVIFFGDGTPPSNPNKAHSVLSRKAWIEDAIQRGCIVCGGLADDYAEIYLTARGL